MSTKDTVDLVSLDEGDEKSEGKETKKNIFQTLDESSFSRFHIKAIIVAGIGLKIF